MAVHRPLQTTVELVSCTGLTWLGLLRQTRPWYSPSEFFLDLDIHNLETHRFDLAQIPNPRNIFWTHPGVFLRPGEAAPNLFVSQRAPQNIKKALPMFAKSEIAFSNPQTCGSLMAHLYIQWSTGFGISVKFRNKSTVDSKSQPVLHCPSWKNNQMLPGNAASLRPSSQPIRLEVHSLWTWIHEDHATGSLFHDLSPITKGRAIVMLLDTHCWPVHLPTIASKNNSFFLAIGRIKKNLLCVVLETPGDHKCQALCLMFPSCFTAFSESCLISFLI